LKQYPGFLEFLKGKPKDKSQTIQGADSGVQTPDEQLEDAYQESLRSLNQELLTTVKACSPEFFEKLVVELLLRMGYGGSRKDAGEAVGKSGDGGIDGIIKEDPLGLGVLYLQAKRWEASVGSPEIQKFVGAFFIYKQNAGRQVLEVLRSKSLSALCTEKKPKEAFLSLLPNSPVRR